MENTEVMNQVAEKAVEEVVEKAPVILNHWQMGGLLGGVFTVGALVGAAVAKHFVKKETEPKPEKKEKKGWKNFFKKKEKLAPGEVAAENIEELPDEEPEVES